MTEFSKKFFAWAEEPGARFKVIADVFAPNGRDIRARNGQIGTIMEMSDKPGRVHIRLDGRETILFNFPLRCLRFYEDPSNNTIPLNHGHNRKRRKVSAVYQANQ